MTKILHLTLKREFFAAIAAKKKPFEYREQKPYWRKRLEGRKYDVIKFRNGYSPDSPEMMVEFRGVSRGRKGRRTYYAIRLGRILKIKRWKASKQATPAKAQASSVTS
jgi:hypothetical protein